MTSDCPVFTAKIQDGKVFLGYGFEVPDVSVFLAIDPSHLFVASPPGSTWVATLGRADVDLVNLFTIQYGHREVYADRESTDLQKIVDENIDRKTCGKDVYVSARVAAAE